MQKISFTKENFTYNLEQFNTDELIEVYGTFGKYCVSMWLELSTNEHCYRVHEIESGLRLPQSFDNKNEADLFALILSNNVKGNEATAFVKIVGATIRGLTAILLLCFLSFTGQGQTKVKQDASGNYTSVSKSAQGTSTKATETGKTYTDKDGKKYPVLQSKNGKLFIVRTSAKTGRSYNQYLLTSK